MIDARNSLVRLAPALPSSNNTMSYVLRSCSKDREPAVKGSKIANCVPAKRDGSSGRSVARQYLDGRGARSCAGHGVEVGRAAVFAL